MRRSDMRAVISLKVVMLALALGVASSAEAAGRVRCNVVIDGTGDPAQDVPAVTQAVNAPGLSGSVTVCLRGTFDFGEDLPTASLQISPAAAVTALTIAGLDDQQGHKAVIQRGVRPFTFPPGSTLARLVITNLR